ncbi:uncharacterized membrane protein At1g16860 [Ziziphus jujuba]|uniref:Uncharacterized membrane protein At1g16860 n=2 Tax=Ziziphus jujuba TaxID=326968 RepID=A0A6P6GE19_ZIZJJ|nr:uncharacterized membrane protein At1g16860 [Ziziphus jujuba]KAH7519440.1 hypothetical protein FEM48_Zijuj08G0036400 [Ziziphus jujuba var. spinosa]
MNDLSNAALLDHHCSTCKPIPSLALYILTSLFVIGLSVSIFILIVVHNAFFFVSFLLVSAIVLAFILWNTRSWRRRGAMFFFLSSLPETDLRLAQEGQLVKITGLTTCGSISLESSYERATRCLYASTLLYEYGGLALNLVSFNKSCFQWSLAYCERFSTDFYITDKKSGLRAMVKAGSGCKVVPLILESRLINTTRECRILSPYLTKWLRERNLSVEARLLRLEEGYVQEGSSVTVVGLLRRNNDTPMIVQPPEIISTGCLWQKLLLPVDIDGLILSVSQMAGLPNNNSVQNLEP